ncbi:TolC family protein [Parabacteroides sp. AF48-14]|uniref:TolC family protein n=1 Tax=Parabacteroides sp. AF48-14 TaxID=2292052 RepID=UPI000EFFF29A|nr:TolC family protein [Parabacteroides sp. AF48-14]RHO71886.1 TolC family protein [Parabacteroides sp. AF48-14]
MEQILITKKMMRIVLVSLSALVFIPVKAQDTLVLDIGKALEIALSENPTVKVADKEIQKKKYAQKGSYASLFPQISFAADYNRTLKKQVMYMDGFDMGSTEIPGMEDMPSMDEGIEVGRDNNWSLGFNASVPLVNAALWKSLSISAVDVEMAIEQARSSKIAMVNQVKKSYYGVLLANDSYRVFKESYDNAMENYLDIKQKFDQGTVAEYDLIRANVTVKNSEPNMLQAENALVLAKWQLKALLGMDLDINIECEGQLTDFKSDLFGDFLSTDTTLADNTDLRQMDLQAKQLDKTLTMQKFDYLPTLSLTGMYQWTAMNNDFKFKNYLWNPYSMIGVSLSIPIFSGGSKFYKIKQTRNSIEQLNLQREDTQRNLQLAIKQYVDNMNTCVKRFDASQKGVEQAERGYMISQKRYDTGAGTLLEMNDSELALTQAKLNFNQAIYDYMVAKADLEKVLGQQEF